MDTSILNCGICIDIPYDAVETNCCYSLFCSQCLERCTNCPHCRHPNPNASPSHAIRRIISNFPVDCDCGHHTTRGELQHHFNYCPNRRSTCLFCNLEISNAEFLTHVMDDHPHDLKVTLINKKREKDKLKVIMHNDDVTSFDFVITVCQLIFGFDRTKARNITMKAHNDGNADVGIFPAEVARDRVEIAHRMARSNGFPFRLTFQSASD
ncbi:hypothetical protein P9112_000325 [Eukaryota sp. TZLM1-RC]